MDNNQYLAEFTQKVTARETLTSLAFDKRYPYNV
jgi:hypothetical protein